MKKIPTATWQHVDTGRICEKPEGVHPGRRWVQVPDGSLEGECPSCGYRALDAVIHNDHHLCDNAGNEPWRERGP